MRDPIELEVFKNLYHSIAEEMGAALRRTAFSPNIKERRDYSCAVFDARGHVIAMGDHMPVHLGSMPMSVAAPKRPAIQPESAQSGLPKPAHCACRDRVPEPARGRRSPPEFHPGACRSEEHTSELQSL